jgi:Mce-associated membrane protein
MHADEGHLMTEDDAVDGADEPTAPSDGPDFELATDSSCYPTPPASTRRPKPTKAEKLEAKAARLRVEDERRAADTAAGRAPQRVGFVISTAVLGVVAAALLALLVVLFFSWHHQRDVNSARDDAVAAAKSFALDFGAYDYQHLDTEFQEVAQKMTPDFAKSYLDTSEKLKATFVQYKTQVTARIQDWGVTSASTSKATVIVFLDQTVRTSQSSTPRIDRNRLEIQLEHTDGKWLVAKLLAK